MKLTRRSFVAAAGAAPFILRAQTGGLRARVKIDTERTIGDIDPKLYGNFVEHLGRCIEGGVFEEKLAAGGCERLPPGCAAGRAQI